MEAERERNSRFMKAKEALKIIKSKKGVSILLVLLTLPVLLTLAAFVINLATSYSTIEQSKSFTRLLSLIALEQYFETTDIPEFYNFNNEQVAAVHMGNIVNRVNSLARSNTFSLYSDKRFSNLCLPWNVSRRTPCQGGTITPGTYYYSNSVVTNEEGEEEERCIQYPCFAPFTTSQEFYGTVPNSGNPPKKKMSRTNAFKIEAQYVPSLSMKLFGSFLGDNLPYSSYCATSTVIATNFIFAVDVSGSSTFQTHKIRTLREQHEAPPSGSPSIGLGGFFAYPAAMVDNPATPPNCDTQPYYSDPDFITRYCEWKYLNEGPPVGADPPRTNPAPSPYFTRSTDPNHLRNPQTDPDPSRHYPDEYESGRLINGPEEQYYKFGDKKYHFDPDRVEKYRSELLNKEFYVENNLNIPPQPLFDIIRALYSGISTIDARKISSDKVGIIFFEKTLSWLRIFKLNRNLHYYLGVPDNYTGQYFPRILSDVYDSHLREQMIRHAIFPTGESHTDIYVALLEAFDQIMENRQSLNGAPSFDHIVYIGDFVPNCVNEKLIDPSSATSNRVCDDSFTYFNHALRELWTLVHEKLIPNNIKLHVILLGEHVGPHTLDICVGNPPVRMTDKQARLSGKDFVKGNGPAESLEVWDARYDYNYGKDDTPFYQAGYEAYRLVRATGGEFRPILRLGAVPACGEGDEGRLETSTDPQAKQIEDSITYIAGIDNPYKLVSTDCAEPYWNGY